VIIIVMNIYLLMFYINWRIVICNDKIIETTAFRAKRFYDLDDVEAIGINKKLIFGYSTAIHFKSRKMRLIDNDIRKHPDFVNLMESKNIPINYDT